MQHDVHGPWNEGHESPTAISTPVFARFSNSEDVVYGVRKGEGFLPNYCSALHDPVRVPKHPWISTLHLLSIYEFSSWFSHMYAISSTETQRKMPHFIEKNCSGFNLRRFIGCIGSWGRNLRLRIFLLAEVISESVQFKVGFAYFLQVQVDRSTNVRPRMKEAFLPKKRAYWFI